MGKYPKPSILGDYDDYFLRIIANELAEANRLKRIEIKYGHGTVCSYDQRMDRESDLEDQA